jgi:hypothetical protein
MSSRLFQKIREERGLCYSVYTYSSSYEVDGMFTAYAGTTVENYKEVVDIIKAELEDIRTNGVSEDELHKAKNQLLSSMIIGLETSKSRMSRMANNYMGHGRIIEVEEIRLRDAAAAFFRYNEVKGLAVESQKAYIGHITRFINFFDDDKMAFDINSKEVEKYFFN